MSVKNTISNDVRRDIEIRAYLIWESEGRPHGREHEHWARAEAEILGGPQPSEKPAGKAARAKTAAPSKAQNKPPAKAKRAAKSKALKSSHR
jgi:hypothetical protein